MPRTLCSLFRRGLELEAQGAPAIAGDRDRAGAKPEPPYPPCPPCSPRSTYHADNEYCLFSDMQKGFRILVGVISDLEDAGAD